MKCKSCGGEISLTDTVCPYCGRELTETASHRAVADNYKRINKRTGIRLKKVISENAPMVISTAVMLFLIIGICVAGYISENAYHFKEDAKRRESVKKYDEFAEEIKRYLDAGDYTGFAAFKEYHNIAVYKEPYDDLKLLWDITEEYADLVHDVESAVIYGEDARRYRPEGNVLDCRLAINDFYHEFESKNTEIETDPYRDHIYDMKDKADLILEVYLGLDEDEREAFLAGSVIEQEAYLEEIIVDE